MEDASISAKQRQPERIEEWNLEEKEEDSRGSDSHASH